MKSLRKTLAKLSVVAMIIGMAAGCASVTDATLPELADQPAATGQVTAPDTPDNIEFGGNEVDPIIDRPR